MGIQEFDFASGKVLDPNRHQALVFSDDLSASDQIESYLRSKHYRFLGKGRDTREILELIRKFKVGVAFLDMDLGGVDVMGLMETLVKKSKFKVVLVTESPTKELLQKGQDSGVAGFLVKPIAKEALEKTLERLG